jgi:hypothetical protein
MPSLPDRYTHKPSTEYGERGEFLPTQRNELACIMVSGDKEVIYKETRELFDEFLEFAVGWHTIEYGGKKLNPPLHTSGRYATSLSFSIRSNRKGSYIVTFKATGEAPEAFAIEFGRKKIDLKKYMLLSGESLRIPLNKAGNGASSLPELSGQSGRKSFSKSNRLMSTNIHDSLISDANKSGMGIRTMSQSQKDKWVMNKWPHRREEDHKMIALAPAETLLQEIKRRMEEINSGGEE